MSDFERLIVMAEEIDKRVAAYRLLMPEKATELDALSQTACRFREQAERLRPFSIHTAPTEDLKEVYDLMGETMGLIRLFDVDRGTLQ